MISYMDIPERMSRIMAFCDIWKKECFLLGEKMQMDKTGQYITELSEETAAQILKNVFAACHVAENKIPLHELKLRYQRNSQRRLHPEK